MTDQDKTKAQLVAELEELRRKIEKARQAEIALEESETRLRNILEHSSNLFYSHTADHVLTYLSPQVEEILGVTVEEAMVRWTEFATDNPINEEGFKKTEAAIETGIAQPPYELELKHSSGRTLWVEVREEPVVEHGKTVAIVGALTDITGRKDTEQKLLESRQRLQTIFDSSGEYIMLLDREHRIQLINRTEPGVDREEAIGRPLYDFLAPEEQERFRGHLDRVVREGEVQQFDSKFTRPDGTRVQFSNVASPIVVDDEIQGSVINALDVSELKRLEEQSRQAQKVESIGRLAGGVAHDLNNLLSPIIGYSDLLLMERDLDPERREYVDQIMLAGTRARDLVRQLLAFSRKQTLEYKPVDVNQAVAGFEKLLRRTIREDVDIVIRPAADIPPIMADIGQIEQVILNLAINAQDAMPEGGRLTIETTMKKLGRRAAVVLGEMAPGPYVILTISDTGCGMDEEVKEKLFEPFFSTKGERGTGLGLSTVYGIVKQHRGNIQVESQPQEGSVFRIYLPVSPEAVTDNDQSAAAATTLNGNETILVVEDSDQVGRLAKVVLERHGYTVLSASNGTEAMEVLNAEDQPVHLLLSDVVMPEMNGRELYSRARELRPTLKVLYMSGYTGDVIASQGILDEGIALIEKPFTHNSLLTKVRQVLDQ